MSVLNRFFRAMSSGNRNFPNSLHSKIWVSLSISSRMKALNLLEKTMAEKQGRPYCDIVFMKMPENHYGFYNHERRMIVLNRELVRDPSLNIKAIDTVIHEGRHCFQYLLTERRIKTRENVEIDKWVQNRFFYFHPDKLFYYYFQPIERDAFNYALQETISLYITLMNKLGEDRNFDIYLWDSERMKQYMTDVAEFTIGKEFLAAIDKSLREEYIKVIESIDLKSRHQKLIQTTGPTLGISLTTSKDLTSG